MAAILARGYTDPAQYATDLWVFAWPLATEDEIRDDVAEYIAEHGPDGAVRQMQADVANDPRSAIPEQMRDVLRDWAAKGGE